MLFKRIGFTLILALGLTLLRAQNNDLKEVLGDADEMTINAEHMDADTETGKAHAKGKVQINYGKVTLRANEVWIDQETRDFAAEGDVVISLEDGTSWAAQKISGNLETKAFAFGQYGFDGKIWHSGGESGTNDKDGNKQLTQAWLTTCDHYPPHYRVSASKITHNPDNTFTAKHIVLKFGMIPVFYFPYIIGTTDSTAGMIIRPGYSGKRGAYLRLGRIWQFGERHSDDSRNEGRVYADFMTKRGVGLGGETTYQDGKQEWSMTLYGLLDSEPPETEHGWDRRFSVKDERYRVKNYYRYDYTDALSLRTNVDWLSDIDMLEDWFKHEYRQVNQPKTFVSVNYDDELFHAAIQARPRVNDFYSVVQKLPEATFDIPRVELGRSPIHYQSSTSTGLYYMKWRDYDRKRRSLLGDLYDYELHEDPSDYHTFRADTTHFLYLPLELGSALNFTPRAGVKGTYYSRSSRRALREHDLANMFQVDDPDYVYTTTAVKNYDSNGGEVFRVAYEIGAELKTKLYSDWVDWKWELFELDGVRHVVEPYVNYTFSPDPSHDRKYLYFFDETDRLERQHFVRLGLDQRWQTRRDGQAFTFLRWQNYVDFHFDRGVDYDAEEWNKGDGRHPGDFGSRLDFQPYDSFSTWTSLLHDVGEGEIQRGEYGLRFGREEELNLSLRYVYRNDHFSRSVYSFGSTLADFTGESSYYKKYFETADTINGEIHIPLNARTSLDIEMEYDFEKHSLSEHRYIINRILHCWVMSLGFGWNNDDFEALIMFHLTAFPKVKIDLNL